MNYYLFGYGSLMLLESAEKCLSRRLHQSDLIPVTLSNYIRLWNTKEKVFSSTLNRQINAVFLSIQKIEKDKVNAIPVNGVLLKINQSELEMLKLREKNYYCETVNGKISSLGNNIRLEELDFITFIGLQEHSVTVRDHDVFIMDNYMEKASRACQLFGNTFTRNFKQSTKHHNFKILEGEYSFVDPNQAKLV